MLDRRSLALPRLSVLLSLLTLAAAGSTVRAQAVEQAAGQPLAVTYADQLREYGSYRRLPDTTATGAPDAGIVRLEIDGLVTDQTITKLGRDFYDLFYRIWQPPDGAINFTITIQEQPLPNLGTVVTVLVNEEPVLQARLQPREDVIEGAAGQAVSLAYRRLQVREAAAGF